MHEAWYYPDMLPTMVHGQAFLIIFWQLASRRHHLSPPEDTLNSPIGLSLGGPSSVPTKIYKQRHKSSKTQKRQNVWWSINRYPSRSTWIHSQILVVFVLLNL